MSLANSDFEDFGGGDSLEYSPDPSAENPVFSAPTPVKKKGFNIYSVMLILSFVMTLAAAIMLFSQISAYK